MKPIIQRPSIDGNWLYQDNIDGGRDFATIVCRPYGSEPWAECTNEEKEEWEREHPAPEPPENE